MKTTKVIIIFVILLSLPIIARGAFYYRGIYESTSITRPEITNIAIPSSRPNVEFVDSFEQNEAVVTFDLAHDNNFAEAELNVLLGRLTARGSHPEYLMLGDSLHQKLRRAQGFVVISPRITFTDDEMREIVHFVESGGKLLLVTDPTRYEIVFDPMGMPLDRKSDVAVMNMLSASFGLIFQDDFIYNMTTNAGTFRDIVLTSFGEASLTEGVEEVLFFAAHSINTSGEPIITTDDETLSSLTEQQGGLIVAALTAGGHVLGVSDLTFMTEPYSSMANNDQLISNIADFLVSGHREYTLADFPYFFGNRVDLRYAGQKAIGGEVLSQAGLLQGTFDTVGKKLVPRKSDTIDSDVLFIGLYDGIDYVQEILATRQVSITLETDAEDTQSGGPEQVAPAQETPAAIRTPQPADTEDPADLDEQAGVEPIDVDPNLLGLEQDNGLIPTEPEEKIIKGKIFVADLGEFSTESVTLISTGEENGHNVMVVLAASENALAQVLDILAIGDLSQCLTGDQSALCPSEPVTLLDELESLEDFYLPPPDSEIPMSSTFEFIEPIEPPLLPD